MQLACTISSSVVNPRCLSGLEALNRMLTLALDFVHAPYQTFLNFIMWFLSFMRFLIVMILYTKWNCPLWSTRPSKKVVEKGRGSLGFGNFSGQLTDLISQTRNYIICRKPRLLNLSTKAEKLLPFSFLGCGKIFLLIIAHARYIKFLTWLRGFRDKLQIFHNSIVSHFPEETWAQRKPIQILKNEQQASESC